MDKFTKGEYYYSLTYSSPGLRKPVIGCFEFLDSFRENDEVKFLFKHIPYYRNDEDETPIEFTKEQVSDFVSENNLVNLIGK